MNQAAEGLKLFAQQEKIVELDEAGARAFKEEMDKKISDLEAEAALLTGKENKKARTEKDKEKLSIKNDKKYIDACKVCKGLEPVHGHFGTITQKAPPPEEKTPPKEEKAPPAKTESKKEAKPKKAMESAGLNPEEKVELDKLKNDIIDMKKDLKDAGMTGGQINKDPNIVKMVTRLNELKEKESGPAPAKKK